MGTKHLPDLSKVEWELMNEIWRHDKVTVSEIHAAFYEARGWNHNTVKTMMQRLVKKGYLSCDDSQRAHVYNSIVPRQSVVHHSLTDILDRILDNSLSPLVAYAAERRNLSSDEIANLKQILENGNEPIA